MTASMRRINLEVTGLGLCTPLGLQANIVPYVIETGTVRFFETSVVDVAGEPVRASILALLEENASRTERMTAMLAPALEDCLTGGPPMHQTTVPVILALPRADEGTAYSVDELVAPLAPLAAQMQFGTLAPPVLVQEGRASFFRALELAAEKLQQIEEANPDKAVFFRTEAMDWFPLFKQTLGSRKSRPRRR